MKSDDARVRALAARVRAANPGRFPKRVYLRGEVARPVLKMDPAVKPRRSAATATQSGGGGDFLAR